MEDKVWKEIIDKKAHVAASLASSVAQASVSAPAHTASPSPTKSNADYAPAEGSHEAELQAWFAQHTKVVPKFAAKYAVQLVEAGIGSIDKLRKKLVRNPEYLLDLNFDEDDADEIATAVQGEKPGKAEPGVVAEKEYKVRYPDNRLSTARCCEHNDAFYSLLTGYLRP
jgi:hypothetical protein